MYKRWKYWDDPENDPRWNAEQFQFSTSPKTVYKRLTNSPICNSGMNRPGEAGEWGAGLGAQWESIGRRALGI